MVKNVHANKADVVCLWQGGATVRVTPPPEALVRGDVLAGVRARAEMVADALGLNGAALLDALIHADTADLVLIETHAIPDLSPSSDLYQQVRPKLFLP